MGEATKWSDWSKLWLYVTAIAMAAGLFYGVYRTAFDSSVGEWDDYKLEWRQRHNEIMQKLEENAVKLAGY
jgi:hypothetical protein